MQNFSSVQFSKFTNSPRDGGAVQYMSDTKTLRVTPETLLTTLDSGERCIAFRIGKFGGTIVCVVRETEYHDKFGVDPKAYILVPTARAIEGNPELADTSIRIALVD